MIYDYEHDVTTCGCGLAAAGRLTDHPCARACARVPAHLAAALGVDLAEVVTVADRMDPRLYDRQALACDPGRCRVCRGRSAGRLSALGAEAVMDIIRGAPGPDDQQDDDDEESEVIDVSGMPGWSAERDQLDDGSGAEVDRAERVAVGHKVAVVRPVGGEPEVLVDGSPYSVAGARALSLALWEAAQLAERALLVEARQPLVTGAE